MFLFLKGTAGGQQSSYVQSVGEAKGHVCVAVEVDRVNLCKRTSIYRFSSP